jgi:hypothetical protein
MEDDASSPDENNASILYDQRLNEFIDNIENKKEIFDLLNPIKNWKQNDIQLDFKEKPYLVICKTLIDHKRTINYDMVVSVLNALKVNIDKEVNSFNRFNDGYLIIFNSFSYVQRIFNSGKLCLEVITDIFFMKKTFKHIKFNINRYERNHFHQLKLLKGEQKGPLFKSNKSHPPVNVQIGPFNPAFLMDKQKVTLLANALGEVSKINNSFDHKSTNINLRLNRLIINYKKAPPVLIAIESTLQENHPRNLQILGLPQVLFHWSNHNNFCTNCACRGHYKSQCSVNLKVSSHIKDRYPKFWADNQDLINFGDKSLATSNSEVNNSQINIQSDFIDLASVNNNNDLPLNNDFPVNISTNSQPVLLKKNSGSLNLKTLYHRMTLIFNPLILILRTEELFFLI